MLALSLALVAGFAPQVEDRHATIPRLPDDQAPRIDGRLDDACWENVPAIGEMVQVEPKVALPSQDTVIKLAYDSKQLYIGVHCFDERPDLIRATQRSYDARLDPDDRLEILFDPFRNQNQAYYFQIGAGGSLGDAISSPTSFTKSWDTIWNGRVIVDDRGWHAEMAIPFRSIAFPEEPGPWGFNIRRVRRWTNESYRWAWPSQRWSFQRLTRLGTIDGIRDVDNGLGVDVVPYVAFTRRRQRLEGIGWDSDPDAGGDVFVRITPSLDAAVTLYTDFAQTEDDSRQINLTRFPLFFRERRDFFLRDASRFSFGPGTGRFLPFFSRRIGIGDDGEIPIEVGAKVAGQAGPMEVGFLAVNTGEGGGNDFRRDLGVLRLNYSTAEQTRVGMIMTSGRPTERGSNQVGGVDMFHRELDFIGDMDLRLWAYALVTQTSGVGGDGSAGGVRFASQGREYTLEGETRWVGDEYNPELGFVRRRDVKDFRLDQTYRPRSNIPGMRRWRFGTTLAAILDQSNTKQDLDLRTTPFGFEMNSEDEFRIFVNRTFDRVNDAFTIFDDIEVPPGDYFQTRGGIDFEFSEGRPISGEFRSSWGDFWDGNAWEMDAEIEWRTSALLILSASYDQTRASLFGRRFTSRVAQGRVDLHFTPRLSVLNLIQFDNQSDNLGLQSRTRWIVEPGSDLFVVLTAGWLKGDDDTFRPDTQELAVKFSYVMRF